MSNEANENEFIDVIEDLGLDDPNLESWDGEGGNWQPIPPGEYVLSVKDAAKHTSKEGKPSVKITFEVASDGESIGKEIRHNYYSLDKSGKGFGRLVALVRALGVPTLPGGGLSIESMKGLLCIAEVYIEESEYFSPKKNGLVKGSNNRVKNEQPYNPEPVKQATQPAKPVQATAPAAQVKPPAATGKTRQAVTQPAK